VLPLLLNADDDAINGCRRPINSNTNELFKLILTAANTTASGGTLVEGAET